MRSLCVPIFRVDNILHICSLFDQDEISDILLTKSVTSSPLPPVHLPFTPHPIPTKIAVVVLHSPCFVFHCRRSSISL